MTVKDLRENSRTLGISIVLSGVPLGMYTNYFVSNNGWSDIYMILGVSLVICYHNLTRIKFPSISKGIEIVALFQIVCFIYMICGYGKDRTFTYQLFSMTFAFALMTCRKNFLAESVIATSWALTGLCSILAYYCLSHGLFKEYEEAAENVDMSNKYILEAFTMSLGCVQNIAASLFFKPKLKYKIFSIGLPVAFIILDFYNVILLGKRTPVVISFLVLVAFIYTRFVNNKRIQWTTITKYSIIASAVVFIVLISNDLFMSQFDHFVESFRNGVNDMAYGTNTDGHGSAVARYRARQRALDFLEDNINVSTLLIGNGLQSIGQIDIPPLQLFCDMGILGISMYAYCVVCSIRVIMLDKSNSNLIIFASLMTFYPIFSCLNSGHPYQYRFWLPMAFFFFAKKQVSAQTKNQTT